VSTDHIDVHGSNQTFELVLDRGTRYIVVDCGGGTVDITVHELDNKMGTLKELYKATGGPYGSVGRIRMKAFSDEKRHHSICHVFTCCRCRSRIRKIDEHYFRQRNHGRV
jgi:hypothetical protein